MKMPVLRGSGGHLMDPACVKVEQVSLVDVRKRHSPISEAADVAE